LKKPEDEVRRLFQDKLRTMRGDKTFLGDIQGDRYHHNVMLCVLKDLGFDLKRVSPNNYQNIFDSGKKYFVYGSLNYDFAPSYMKGRKLYWRNQQCKQAAFHGNEPLPGAHDAHQYHAVVIRAGMLYCSNLVDEEGERFGADAKQLLPLTGASKDGQFRICGNKPLAYLTSISRVFRLVKEPVSARGKRGKAAGRKQRQKAKKKQKTANAA
jgi:hypothetical protein